jgi:radical SAM protein with 4Fe4S-binding SPASM domain
VELIPDKMAVRLFSDTITTSIKELIPLSALFELTYKCNFKCKHCYITPSKKKRELSTQEIESILTQLAMNGTFSLSLSGGEIFCRDDIWEILKFARKKKFLIKLYTNGSLLDEEAIRRLKELSIYEIHVSLYSLRARVFDQICGVKGAFSKVIQTINLLHQHGLYFKIKIPLMKHTFQEYQKLIQFTEQYQPKSSYNIDLTIVPKNNGSKLPLKFRIDKQDLYYILSDAKVAPSSSPRSSSEKDPLADIPCNAGFNVCSISPYGEVYPCLQLLVPCGNLREKSFSEIWKNSETLKNIRKIKTSHLKECRVCSVKDFCARCPGLAHLENGNLLGASSRACEIAKVRQKIFKDGTKRAQGKNKKM